MPPGGTESPGIAGRPGQVLHFYQFDARQFLNHELRDPVAAFEGDGHPWVQVDEAHMYLTPVPGVDRAGPVHDPDPVPGGQTAARMHERCVPVRQRDGQAGGQQFALTGLQGGIDPGAQIQSGIPGVGIRR